MSTHALGTQEGTDTTERITDVAALDAGDRILVGNRSRPITVTRTGVIPIVDPELGEAEQPVAEAAGEWANAKTIRLTTRLDGWTLKPAGEIVVDGAATEVRRVERS